MQWVGHLAHMSEKRDAQQNFSQKPKGKRHLEDVSVDGRDMVMCHKDIGQENVSWLYLAQDRELV